MYISNWTASEITNKIKSILNTDHKCIDGAKSYKGIITISFESDTNCETVDVKSEFTDIIK